MANPSPSDKIVDFKTNAESLDEYWDSESKELTTRLSKTRKTAVGQQAQVDELIQQGQIDIAKAIRDAGYQKVGTFESGATLTDFNQALEWAVADGGDGNWYRWDGAYNKVVPASSTPAGTGGVAAGAWINVTDLTLRSELPQLIALGGRAVFPTFASLGTGTTKDGQLDLSTIQAMNVNETTVRTTSFYSGWAATIDGDIGGAEYKVLTTAQRDAQGFTSNSTIEIDLGSGGIGYHFCIYVDSEFDVSQVGFVNDGITDNDVADVLNLQKITRSRAVWGDGDFLITGGNYLANFYFNWKGNGLNTKILFRPTSDVPLVHQKLNGGGSTPSYDLGDENTLNGAEIVDINIKGNRSQLCSGLKFEQCDKLKLENVYVDGIKGSGFILDSCREYTLDGLRTRWNGDRLTQRPDYDINSDNPATENNNFAHIRGCFSIYPFWSNLYMDNCSAMSISGGLMLHAIPLGTIYAGTHTGANDAAILTVGGTPWTVDQLVGKIVRNITDGSQGVITANTANTITATLTGGVDNDWDTSDEYAVEGDQETSAKIFYQGEFGNTTDIDDWYDNWYKVGGGIESHTLHLNDSIVQADHIKSYAGGREPIYVSGGLLTCSDFNMNGSDKKNGADFCLVADNNATVKLANARADNTQQIFDERNSGKVAISSLTKGTAIGAAQAKTGSAASEMRGDIDLICSSLNIYVEDSNGNLRQLAFTPSGNNVRIDPQAGFVNSLGGEPFNSNYVDGDIWSQNGAIRVHTNNGTKYLGTKTSVPASYTSAGRIGDWAIDGTYVYFYTGDGITHSWPRIAHSGAW